MDPDEPRRLPDIVETTGDASEFRLRLRVPDDLGCLEGHFPDIAIVPGVALIGWAEHFAREHLAAWGEVRDVERVKFNQLVRPGRELMLVLRREADGAAVAYRFQSVTDERDLASGRLHFTPAAEVT